MRASATPLTRVLKEALCQEADDLSDHGRVRRRESRRVVPAVCAAAQRAQSLVSPTSEGMDLASAEFSPHVVRVRWWPQWQGERVCARVHASVRACERVCGVLYPFTESPCLSRSIATEAVMPVTTPPGRIAFTRTPLADGPGRSQAASTVGSTDRSMRIRCAILEEERDRSRDAAVAESQARRSWQTER